MLKKRLLCGAGGLIALAAIGALSAPKLKAAIKAAFVEVVQPSQPFFISLFTPFNGSGPSVTGLDQGTIGVTNITVSSFADTPSLISIFQPEMSPGSNCFGQVLGGGGTGEIFIEVNVPPHQTVTLPFPTPLVFTPKNGHSCIAVEGGAPELVKTFITGFVN